MGANDDVLTTNQIVRRAFNYVTRRHKVEDAEVLAELLLLNRNQIFQLIAASQWMDLGVYNNVQTSFSGNQLTLSYYEHDHLLGIAVITFSNANTWTLAMSRYITEDDGEPLLNDDSTELNLD